MLTPKQRQFLLAWAAAVIVAMLAVNLIRGGSW
jgi:hypothetical protein